MPDKAADYRRRAGECLKAAEAAKYQADIQRQYLELAQGWTMLALQVEEQQRRRSNGEE
jgi:hypothetical protein